MPDQLDHTAKGQTAVYSLNGRGRGCITLSFDRIPKHCGECQLYIENIHFDEDGFFGDGMVHQCPFGASSYGCLVERPADCPIVLTPND